MKRLTPPILQQYTDKQLAVELDVPHWKIVTACETGDIEAEFVPERSEVLYSEPGWVGSYTGRQHVPSRKVTYGSYWIITKDAALRFEAELFATERGGPLPDTQAENPKATDTLLKLIAVMAVDAYDYDYKQERSSIPSEIVQRAQERGISLDPKTVRKWLKQAVATHIPTGSDTL